MTLHPHALLTASQMAALDKAAIGNGIEGYALMQKAGRAVAEIILQRFQKQEVVVLAGPGNNGGDGWVIAEHLRQQKWPVIVAHLSERDALKGDAAKAAANYAGEAAPLASVSLEKQLIVDALFGTGMTRAIEGEAKTVIGQVTQLGLPVVAVDIPSGVDGATGKICGAAFDAKLTVTFHRKKLGHVLYPGKAHAGEVVLVDIGISDELEPEGVVGLENDPTIWLGQWPWPAATGHKYSRGHVLVQGGNASHTGAARLAARAALRIAAGAVTVLCEKDAVPVYAEALESEMLQEVNDLATFESLLDDERKNTMVIGPAAGVGDATRQRVLSALKYRKQMVIDADALTSFEGTAQTLYNAIASPCILTPHEGEFWRVFPDVDADQPKHLRALEAARLSSAVVVLKGADTVIAAPDGNFIINTLEAPQLATAGAGDVLAGICGGLMAAGMPAFEAAAAGVWIHGRAAQLFGAGLIASDLPDLLPKILQSLQQEKQDHA